MIGFLFGTQLGKYLLIGGAIALAIGGLALWFYGQGEAAAGAAAAAATVAGAAKANKARAAVRPNDKEAIDNDPYNRDR